MAGIRQVGRPGVRRWGLAWVAAALAGAVVLVALAGGPARSGGDEGKAQALPPDLLRVPGDAAGFLSVRLGDVWNADMAKGLRERLAKEAPAVLDEWREALGVAPGDVERMTQVLTVPDAGQGLIIVATARPYDRAQVLAAVAPDGTEEKRGGHVLYVGIKGNALHFIGDRAFVFGRPEAVRDLLGRPAAATEGRLTAALRLAAGKHAAVVGLNPEAIARALGDQLPPQAEPFKPLLLARLATLTADLDEGLPGDLRLTFAGEKEAREAEPVVKTGLKFAGTALAEATKQIGKGEGGAKLAELIRRAAADLGEATVRQEGTRVEASAHVKLGPEEARTFVDSAVLRVQEASKRIQSVNNLKQLTLATINYADANGGSLPPQGVFGADGKPLLSWRVLILPYVEQDALYKEFHLDEPWDSAHNKKLLAKMPPVFRMPGSPAGTTETYYQAFVGPGAFFEGRQRQRFPASFTDGTSNTIMYVEAAKGVPWTKPEDLSFDPDPKKPLPKLGGHFRGGFNVGMCDGSVRFILKTISDTTLRAAITRNGGEVLGPDF
jgi:prepilin-type processing-associated H-X9-DG protein